MAGAFPSSPGHGEVFGLPPTLLSALSIIPTLPPAPNNPSVAFPCFLKKISSFPEQGWPLPLSPPPGTVPAEHHLGDVTRRSSPAAKAGATWLCAGGAAAVFPGEPNPVY